MRRRTPSRSHSGLTARPRMRLPGRGPAARGCRREGEYAMRLRQPLLPSLPRPLPTDRRLAPTTPLQLRLSPRSVAHASPPLRRRARLCAARSAIASRCRLRLSPLRGLRRRRAASSRNSSRARRPRSLRTGSTRPSRLLRQSGRTFCRSRRCCSRRRPLPLLVKRGLSSSSSSSTATSHSTRSSCPPSLQRRPPPPQAIPPRHPPGTRLGRSHSRSSSRQPSSSHPSSTPAAPVVPVSARGHWPLGPVAHWTSARRGGGRCAGCDA